MEEKNGASQHIIQEPVKLPTNGSPVQTAAQMPLIKSDRPAETFNMYDQGVLDGMLEVKFQHFEKYIDAYHFREYKNKSIHFLRDQIRELQMKQAEAIRELDILEEKRTEKLAKSKALGFRLDFLNRKFGFWALRIDEALKSRDKIMSIKSDYNLLAGLIFFLFALVFIVADYAICLNIVADALKIGLVEGRKTMISHLFAFAMSGLAVALKPAYDRLVEKPYQESQKKKAFTWFILLLSGSVIVMLLCLGAFREENIATMNKLLTNNGSAELENLQDSTYARVGIISSTVLFAIAGAICLGISLPVIHKNFRILWNRFRIKTSQTSEMRIAEKLSLVLSSQAEVDSELTNIDRKISYWKKHADVDETIEDKRKLIHLYQHGERIQNAERSKSIYLAGYERGEKLIGNTSRDWIIDKIFDSNSPGSGSDFTDPKILPGVKKDNGISKRTRPFVALRRMIAGSFKQKWNTGKDIEIEYYNFD